MAYWIIGGFDSRHAIKWFWQPFMQWKNSTCTLKTLLECQTKDWKRQDRHRGYLCTNIMARGKYKMYGQYVYTDRYGQVCDTSVKDSMFRTRLFSRFGGVPIKQVINQVLKMYAKAYQYPNKEGGKR